MKFHFEKRQKALFGEMERIGISAMLVTDAKDAYYYTGFMPPHQEDLFFLLLKSGETPLLLASTLLNQAESVPGIEVRYIKKAQDALPFLKGIKKIGFDGETMSAKSYLDMSGISFHECGKIMKLQRAVKSDAEIENIKEALRITENVLEGAGRRMEGAEEGELSLEIDIEMLKRGAKPAFENIIASGKNSAFVHYAAGRAVIGREDLTIIDIGALFRHYCADETRTFCMEPSARARKLHEDVLEVQEILMDELRAEIPVKEINAVYEKEMKKRGFEVMHSWGHGIGLSVHEPLGSELKEGMVVTVEPGAYIRGFGGCRIEDMVVIRKGRPLKLTRLPKGL